ncbi:HJR/Mrr/RecB family endonuclease OS=Ureibacillus acetophenoni OX=614649 GN=SAMN05877842_108129 PE=4 SV=1 [Ureibacillus acetophenoni]
MSRQSSKVKENKITLLLLLSILSFGIVISILNFLSIEPSLTDLQFYLTLLVVIALLFKPLRINLLYMISIVVKSMFNIINRFILRKGYTNNANNVSELNCIEVVQFLKPIFEKQGYRTELASNSKELEADLILRKGTKTFVVQTKRKNHKVGTKVLHDVVGVVRQYSANGAIVITNQYYTSSAKKFAKNKNIKLIDRDELMKMLKTTNKKYRFATALSFILNK